MFIYEEVHWKPHINLQIHPLTEKLVCATDVLRGAVQIVRVWRKFHQHGNSVAFMKRVFTRDYIEQTHMLPAIPPLEAEARSACYALDLLLGSPPGTERTDD